ncbi:MAG: glycyl-radical enzyme activating protein [Bacteroidales bacterium]|jgi:pyruvate formate lyase activating enzyme|nr:glycyl-radical enzyme activating protein [Bacteroidales bacterium]
MSGLITTIQRMSIHDGPGIRSAVFMKGCNLRCWWCHNPETWEFNFQLQYINDKCLRCNDCIKKCEIQALDTEADGIRIARERCTLCGKCTKVCPSGALTMIGEQVEAEEVVRRVEQDIIFYEESGGGITLSGGEPLMQLDFTKKILSLCKAKHIHTAIESNLMVHPKAIKALLPLVDLWMCDIKTIDPATHKKYTGVSNERIIKNFKYIINNNATVIARTPVIPGFNDTEECIESICKLIQDLPVKCELLGFHTLGFDKFCQLGLTNLCSGLKPLTAQRLSELKRIFKKYNIKTTHENI